MIMITAKEAKEKTKNAGILFNEGYEEISNMIEDCSRFGENRLIIKPSDILGAKYHSEIFVVRNVIKDFTKLGFKVGYNSKNRTIRILWE